MEKESTIPREMARVLCKLGELSNCCRYLAADKYGMCCLKGGPLQKEVDRRIEAGTFNAKGNHCDGWNSYRRQLKLINRVHH